MKKMLAIILAMLFMLPMSALAAVELPLVEAPVELTIAVLRHTNDAVNSYADKAFVKKLEAETGIHVNWIEILEANWEQQIGVLLAGNMPDAILSKLTDDVVVANTSLFAILDEDTLNTYCPDVIASYEEMGLDWKDYLTYPDGNIYALPVGYMLNPEMPISGTQWINQKWLDAVNMEMPTTAEELYEVLKAFRDNDVNGNGDPSDEIPMSFCQSYYAAKIFNITSMFGVPDYLKITDKTVSSTLDTDAMYDCLVTLHKWVEEGLLDIEGFTSTSDEYSAKTDAMRVGVFCNWAPYTPIKDVENQNQYVPMAPVAFEGYTPSWPVRDQISAKRNGLVINAGSPYIAEVLKLWNYLSQDEDMRRLVAEGEEGLLYKKAEDGLFYTNTPTAEDLVAAGYGDYANNIASSTLSASLGVVNYHPLMKQPASPTAGSLSAIRMDGVNVILPYLNGYKSQSITTAEDQEAFDFATEGLEEFALNFISTSIANGVTEAEFEAFKTELDMYGYADYLEFYQNKLK